MSLRGSVKIKSIFWVAVLVAAVLTAGIIQFTARPAKSLVVLFTHDLHTNLEEYSLPFGNDSVVIAGGYARTFSAIQSERRGREQDVLLVDAGDFSMGTLLHTLRSSDSPELVTMGAMGYDATTFGNHDFDLGPNQLALALFAAKANGRGGLPAIVVSNTWLDPKSASLDSLRKAFAEYPVLPYTVIKRAGLRVGIFGLIGKDAVSDVPQAAPVVFEDYIAAAKQTVNLLRDKERVDLVICLSHCGTWLNKSISEDEILARNVPGIDVIISGHTHTILSLPIHLGNTYIVSCGAFGEYLGRLEIAKTKNKRFKTLSYRLIPITSALNKDAKISSMVEAYIKKLQYGYLKAFNYRYAQKLADCSFSLERPDEVTTGLGDLITDAFRYAVQKTEGENYRKISLVFEPFGQIRVPLAKGTFTVNDAFRVLALGIGADKQAGYSVVTFWATGSEIRNLLEIETSVAPFKKDARLHIAGMRFSYDPKAASYSRVKTVEVELENGQYQPLDDNRLYRVCTNWNVMLMGDYMKNLSAGKIVVVPKDEFGNPFANMRAIRVIYNAQNSTELKEWLALAMYLESFPDINGDGLPDVPARYKIPQDRITALR